MSSTDRGQTFLGLSQAPAHTASGPDRFDSIASFVDGIEVSFPGSERLPSAFCFSGFSPDTFESGSGWETFPNTALFVPDILIVASEGETAGYERDHSQLPFNAGALFDSPAVSVETIASSQLLEDSEKDHEKWCGLVRKAIQSIEDDELHKIVPARGRVGALSDGERWAEAETIEALLEEHENSTVYVLRTPDKITFAGASPELLVRKKATAVESMALAGTAERSSNGHGEGDLRDEKNQREHLVVRDEIVASLNAAGATVTSSSQPEASDYGSIQHLKTSIKGELREDANIFDLVRELHPTPAVCGAPREGSMQWLAQNEEMERGYYAGPFGFIDTDGDGEFHVALRCVLLSSEKAVAYAGAGIVEGSDPEAEWQETGWKLSTIASVLKSARNGE
jgi:menaquinone-specific isochorismate synthase